MSDGRDPKTGKFVKGNPGSLPGRGTKPRSVSFLQAFAKAVPTSERVQFVREQFDLAKSGDNPDLAKFFLSRVLPAVKPISVVPELHVANPSDPVELSQAILQAVASGSMDAATAGDMMKLVDHATNIAETARLGPQLAEMKAALDGMK